MRDLSVVSQCLHCPTVDIVTYWATPKFILWPLYNAPVGHRCYHWAAEDSLVGGIPRWHNWLYIASSQLYSRHIRGCLEGRSMAFGGHCRWVQGPNKTMATPEIRGHHKATFSPFPRILCQVYSVSQSDPRVATIS